MAIGCDSKCDGPLRLGVTLRGVGDICSQLISPQAELFHRLI